MITGATGIVFCDEGAGSGGRDSCEGPGVDGLVGETDRGGKRGECGDGRVRRGAGESSPHNEAPFISS